MTTLPEGATGGPVSASASPASPPQAASPKRGERSPLFAVASSPTSVKTGPLVKYGVSDPISLQEPSDADLALTERMMEELHVAFPAESPEGMRHRQSVLEELEQMVLDWMTAVGVKSGMSEEEARRSTVKITTLGSYRLGVVHPGSDIDTLCIGPPHVSRDDFFTSFVERLSQHQHLSECVPIPDAYTPIIKMKLRNVDIDLLFAKLVTPTDGNTPEELAKHDDVLKDMDEKSVRCLNGFRVADQILKLVPNEEIFRKTLRFIKYWARQRGIYSNVLGYFGGITWSLLVARVCQLYPYNAPSQLVSRFFRVYHQWNWAKLAVKLNEIVEPSSMPGMTGFKVWNPQVNPADRQHIMPVITPAFPAMNSTHNVSETTKRILLDEFKRGYDVAKRIESQNAQWSEVTEPHPFFTFYKHFLCIDILALNEEVFKKFSGWVESKLRILTMQLEQVSGMIIHPNPNQYDMLGSDTEWPFGCSMFVAYSFTKDAGAHPGMRVDLMPAVSQFLEVINNWVDKEAYVDQFHMRFKRIKASELPRYVTDTEVVKKRQRPAGETLGGQAKKARVGA
jgi:poly(A) polymerase